MKNTIMIRFLFIPSGLKQYLLSALCLPFFVFLISDMTASICYATEASMLGLQFRQFKEFFDNPKEWRDKSVFEKISFISTIVFVAATLVILFVMGRSVKRKLEGKIDLREIRRRDEENTFSFTESKQTQ